MADVKSKPTVSEPSQGFRSHVSLGQYYIHMRYTTRAALSSNIPPPPVWHHVTAALFSLLLVLARNIISKSSRWST